MMKKGSFTGLLYREYYLGRHEYITGIIFFTGSALWGWLSVLSLKYGNWGLLFGEDLSDGIIINKEASEALRLMLIIFIKYYPVFMSCFIGTTAIMNIACRDVLNKWNRFEHSTPITPSRFAAVKTISMLIRTGASFILAIIYIFTIDIGLGKSFTYADLSLIVFFLLFIVLLEVLSQIFVTLLKDRDKGMLCAVGTFMLPIFIIISINSSKDSESGEVKDIQSRIAEITDKLQAYFPLMLIVIISLFAALAVSMYLLYKRREK